jgi:alpha-beta hydrolase superfamily lysophospholipase
MTPSSTARPVYLRAEGIDPVFGFLHTPVDARSGETAVLICPPFGWEESCSYRSRRDWAEHLAGAGHPALRIDLPGTGDSGGSPETPGLLTAWTGAICTAAGWLHAMTETQRVVVIGIGLGGLLACHALGEGAPIDELVLWAVPSRGRAFVRELRAFGLMEASQSTEDDGESFQLPAGWTGAGGFVLSAETTRALEGLDLAMIEIPDGQLQRALLLERDGIGVDTILRRRLEQTGAKVTISPGWGYGPMIVEPQMARPPSEVFARVDSWLDEPPSANVDGLTPPPASDELRRPTVPARNVEARDTAELTIDGIHVRETPLAIEQPFGRLFGVLAEPVKTPVFDLGAVLLNPGAHRRIGQNRMWVEAARRWAARGVPTLRLDLEGIGDADGDGERFTELAEMYDPRMVDQVCAALDVLEARGLGRRFVLAGLCSGARWSFEATLRDERVVATFMLNPQSLFWDPSLFTARTLRRGSRSKVLRGEVPLARIVALAHDIPAMVAQRARARWQMHRAGGDELDRALDRLRDTGQHLHFMFSGLEPLYEEFELEGRVQQMDRWPNVSFDLVPGQDHLMKSPTAQRSAHEALDRALEQELQRAGEQTAHSTQNGVRGARSLVKPGQ